MNRKLAPNPHPDWFWSLSGGVDSTAAFLLTKDALKENYHKTPVAVYFDTRIGLPLNRLYVEQLCDAYDVQLWTLRTEEKFEEWVARDGCPGPGAHRHVRNELKGRQSSKLATVASDPVFVLGLQAEEGPVRAAMAKVEQKRRHVEVRPVHRLSKVDCARIILEHEDCPINPCWLWNHFSDCGCLCHGDPSELDAVEERFPAFAQRLREIEEAADVDGLEDTLGWGGLTAVEQSAIRAGQEQATLCSESCGREQDPLVVRAFQAVVDGGIRADGLAILDSQEAVA